MPMKNEMRVTGEWQDVIFPMKVETDFNKWLDLCFQLFQTVEHETYKACKFDVNTGQPIEFAWTKSGFPPRKLETLTKDRTHRYLSDEVHCQILRMLRDQPVLILDTKHGALLVQQERIAVGSSCGHTDYADGYSIRPVTIKKM